LSRLPHDIPLMQTLTPREREIIDYVAQGKANKVIAIELGVSMRTVETHRARIFRKMRVRNATELARRVYAPSSLAHSAALTLHEPGTEPSQSAPQPKDDEPSPRGPASSLRLAS